MSNELDNIQASYVKWKEAIDADLKTLNIKPFNSITEGNLNQVKVLVVGAGMAGLASTIALSRVGVRSVLALDTRQEGEEGVWNDYARMDTLRSPKDLPGLAFGVPSLSFRCWYQTLFGESAWQVLHKIPRLTWLRYLHHVRLALNLPVLNGYTVTRVTYNDSCGIQVETTRLDGTTHIFKAERVVIATGRKGLTTPNYPAWSNMLASNTYSHASDIITNKQLQGKAVCVVGAGASAFDQVAYALKHNALKVTLVHRRNTIPQYNRYESIDSSLLQTGYYALKDSTKLELNRYADTCGVPPPVESIQKVIQDDRFIIKSNFNVTEVSQLEDGKIYLEACDSSVSCDHVIFATGTVFSLQSQNFLSAYINNIKCWKHVVNNNQDLWLNSAGEAPYLGASFEFIPLSAEESWLSNIHCFNHAAILSHGEVASSIPGLETGATRLASGIAAHLINNQDTALIKEMEINCLKHFDQSIFIPNSDSKIINILVQGQNAIRFKNSSYGIRWLRENDPIHKDTATGQRLSSPPNENRLSIEFDYVKEKGTDLIIKWSDKQDESIYSDSWLKHCVSLASAINSKYDNIAQPWLNSQWNIQGFRFDKTYSERDIIDCLQKSGVVLLQNIQHEKLVELAESFGPIYTTEYGKTHPSIAKPLNGIPDLSLSNSGCALSLHTDSTFRETPKLLQWLYCVENKAKGGESIISDSRIAIDILKSEHTNAWNMLTSKTVQFYQYNETQRYIFSRNCPIIEVDDKTSDHKVNVSHKNLEWLLESPDAEEWFSAYTLFFEILNSDRCSVRFRLKKGDCLIIQNWRILHARDTFEPDSGHRELDVFYQAWNYLEARRNFIDFHGFVDN